jgi:hypothetical protein
MDVNAVKASVGKEQGNIELCHKVLDYSDIFRRVVAQAKEPGFTQTRWAPLEELVAVNEFKRVGSFLEVMNWHEYTGFVTQFATASNWEGTFRGIHEHNRVVYLELTERCTTGDRVDVVNSMTVYKFNAAGKIYHLDVYLQRKLEAGQ